MRPVTRVTWHSRGSPSEETAPKSDLCYAERERGRNQVTSRRSRCGPVTFDNDV